MSALLPGEESPEDTITRLADAMMQQSSLAAAEIAKLKERLDEALQLGNEACARIDLLVIQRDALESQLSRALSDIATLNVRLSVRTLERDAARDALVRGAP